MDAAAQDGLRLELIGDAPQGAADATGLSADGRSSYYAQRLVRTRRSKKGRRRRSKHKKTPTNLPRRARRTQRYKLPKWPKVSGMIHTQSHLILAAVFTEGPSHDSPDLPGLMRQTAARVKLDRLLADSGYDAEAHHVLGRETLGIRSTLIALNPRNHGRRWPLEKYRRQMKTCPQRRKYAQRSQAESVWSRHKRRFGWVLATKTSPRQVHECQFKVMLHNITILA